MRRIQDFSGFFAQTTLVLCGDALIYLNIGSALLAIIRQYIKQQQTPE